MHATLSMLQLYDRSNIEPRRAIALNRCCKLLAKVDDAAAAPAGPAFAADQRLEKARAISRLLDQFAGRFDRWCGWRDLRSVSMWHGLSVWMVVPPPAEGGALTRRVRPVAAIALRLWHHVDSRTAATAKV